MARNLLARYLLHMEDASAQGGDYDGHAADERRTRRNHAGEIDSCFDDGARHVDLLSGSATAPERQRI
jgi:hypothetical protein